MITESKPGDSFLSGFFLLVTTETNDDLLRKIPNFKKITVTLHEAKLKNGQE